MDFSETVEASDLRVSRSRHLLEYMKVCEYEGHSRINDNEFISRKVLLDSVLFVMSYKDTHITYSCLKFVAFIMARFEAMII